MADNQIEYQHEVSGGEWLLLANKSTRNFWAAVHMGAHEVTLFEGYSVGRKWVFDEPPSSHGPWRIVPKHKSKLELEPLMVRTVAALVLACEATDIGHGRLNIIMSSPL